MGLRMRTGMVIKMKIKMNRTIKTRPCHHLSVLSILPLPLLDHDALAILGEASVIDEAAVPDDFLPLLVRWVLPPFGVILMPDSRKDSGGLVVLPPVPCTAASDAARCKPDDLVHGLQ